MVVDRQIDGYVWIGWWSKVLHCFSSPCSMSYVRYQRNEIGSLFVLHQEPMASDEHIWKSQTLRWWLFLNEILCLWYMTVMTYMKHQKKWNDCPMSLYARLSSEISNVASGTKNKIIRNWDGLKRLVILQSWSSEFIWKRPCHNALKKYWLDTVHLKFTEVIPSQIPCAWISTRPIIRYCILSSFNVCANIVACAVLFNMHYYYHHRSH